MFWVDFMFVIIFAVILSVLLTLGLGWRHPGRGDAVGTSILFLFLILLFAMWAGGVWLPDWGPAAYGTPWLGLLLIGIFIALLILAVAAPVKRRRATSEAQAVAEEEAVAATAFGAFFWILILGLLVAVIVSYVG